MALPPATTPPRLPPGGDGTRAKVKIPPDWLHEPRFAKRSDLYDARRADMKQLALEKTRVSPYFDLKFARTEALFHDAFRKNGVENVLNKAGSYDPSEFHARAIASGSPTRSAMLERRATDRHLESLKFEPPEIMRLRDIPKPGAPELESWWTKTVGYVEDTSPMIENSLRLQLSPSRRVLGPVDPAKERFPASVDERRRVREAKAQLADKITQICHSVPDSYRGDDRVDASVIIRAPDLYAQERRHGGGGGGGGGSRSESPLMAAVSPIKPIQLRSPKRSHRHIENLFLESTNQRVLLDQLKAASPLPSPMRSPTPPGHSSPDGLNSRCSSSTTLLESIPDKGHAVRDYRTTIRCGGFA